MRVIARQSIVIDMSIVTWISTGIWALAAGIVRRGFMAKSRVHENLTEMRTEALTLLKADHLVPVLRDIVAFVASVEGPISRDEFGPSTEDRIPAALSRADLGAQRQRVTEIGGDASDLDRIQDEIVTLRHREGWVAGAFLVPWSGLVFWSSEKGIRLPHNLIGADFVTVATCFGFWLAEVFAERRASNRFMEIHRTYTRGLS